MISIIESSLSLEQKIKQARYVLQKQKRAKTKNIMLERQYRLFSFLQEPKNKYEIGLEMSINYPKINKLLSYYERAAIIQLVDYNPNKYKLSSKGLYTLHRIKELNKLVNNELD